MVQEDLAAPQQSQPRRRPAQRPAEILDAAAQVFARRGYDRATTKEIAAAAGVSEGTLYRYFENKKGILLALFKDFIDKALADVAHLPAGSFEEWVAHTVASQIRMAHERPFTIMILQQAITDPDVGRAFVEMNTRLRQEVTRQMAKLEATGALRDIDPFVAGEAMGSMIMGLTVSAELGVYGWHEEPLSPETLSKGIADVLMNGLHTRSKVRKSHLKES
jgi:AcrR family transcriptional regulator